MRQIPNDILLAIQYHFHMVIRERAAKLVDEHNLVLPELAALLVSEKPGASFAIPGMYGGFYYWLEGEGKEAKLIAESWSRMGDGSKQRYEVTAEGSRLIEEGFG
jgi:hypothetical protein